MKKTFLRDGCIHALLSNFMCNYCVATPIYKTEE